MRLDELDVIIRVAGATLLILAAVLRLGRGGDWRGRADVIVFVPLALCLCGFLAGNTPEGALRLSGVAGRIGVLLAGYAAVFMWWFCLSVFDRRFRPRGLVLGLGLAWMVIASADRGVFGPLLADKGLSWVLIGLGLIMIGHLAWRLLSDRAGDLIDYRRRARVAVVVLLAGQLLADMLVDILLGMDWQPQVFSIVQNAALLGFTGWLLHLGFSATGEAIMGASVPRRAPPPETAPSALTARLTARLTNLIEIERVHLDPSLSFADFVRRMGASERAVRDLINHQLGHDHFRSFLNAHRMAEARRLLADPARRQDKLIVIAMDAGFASLPSFNRVFQEVEQTSPSAWRRAALSAQIQP